MNFQDLPLSQILSDRRVFGIFDEEFQNSNTWLDVSALVQSESTIQDLYNDQTVPHDILDIIVARLHDFQGDGQEV